MGSPGLRGSAGTTAHFVSLARRPQIPFARGPTRTYLGAGMLQLALAPDSFSPSRLFWAGAAFFFLVQILRGWRLGVVRQGAELFAIGAGYALAWMVGPMAAPYMEQFGVPKALSGFAGGAAVGLATFLFITLLSGLLLKRTEHQSVGLVRFFFGLGGSALALVAGVIIFILAFSGVRLFGTLFEGRVESENAARRNGTTLVNNPQEAQEARAPEPAWAKSLIKMKQELETGLPGSAFRQLDPLPATAYQLAEKLGGLLASQQAMQKFNERQDVRAVAMHPRMLAVMKDPELVKAVQQWDYPRIFTNKNFTEALGDPDFVAALKRVNWQEALQHVEKGARAPRMAPAH